MKTEKEQLFEIQKHIETQKFNFVSDFFKNYPKKNIYNEELKKL